MITIKNTTPRLLCKDIADLSCFPSEKFTKRPLFRFKPDSCGWWLVPSTANPHYQHSKYIFSPLQIAGKQFINAGLHIEKGLGEDLAPVFTSKSAKSFIMNEKWDWNKHLAKLIDGSFFYKISEQINSEILSTLTLFIDGGYVNEPTKFDPYQEKRLGWDSYVFNWDLGSNAITKESSKRSAYILKLDNINSVGKLGSAIKTMAADQWLWLNIKILLPIALSDEVETKTAEDIYQIFLKYLNDYI